MLKFSKVIFINLIILYIFLYIIEISINYKNDGLFKKTRLYYLNKDSKNNFNQKIYLNFGSYKLLGNTNHDIFPLSGYENAKKLGC